MNDLTIKPLNKEDISEIVSAFVQIGWNKPKSLYETYLEEQIDGKRSVFIAKEDGKFCGYVTLKWTSDYHSFNEQHIPEIADLNVLPLYRKKGIGTKLIQACEHLAKDRGKKMVGLGVGLIADYGNAQRLYIHLGFLPDGEGLHYKNTKINYGENVKADDDLVIYLTKSIEGLT